LAIFAVVGFAIPAWLLWIALGAWSHGQPPPVATVSDMELAVRIVPIGFAGAASAVLAWCAIRRSRDHAGDKAPSAQSPNTSFERTRGG
jgi:hypothetical protein